MRLDLLIGFLSLIKNLEGTVQQSAFPGSDHGRVDSEQPGGQFKNGLLVLKGRQRDTRLEIRIVPFAVVAQCQFLSLLG